MSITADVPALLKTLRETPVNSDGAVDSILSPIYDHLMKSSPASSDGRLHWFCDFAEPTTKEAATFLIRLYAYDSTRVSQWKARLENCLLGCPGCVKGLGEVKISSRSTYFGAFPEEVLDGFFRVFDDWELSVVLDSLKRTGVCSDQSDMARKPFSDAPSSTVYHTVSNLRVLQDTRIISLIRSSPPLVPYPDWPMDPPPAGLLILMMDENPIVRTWATAQSSKCQIVPIPIGQFTPPYITAVEAIAQTLAVTSQHGHSQAIAGNPVGFSFTQKPVDQWAAFITILRLIPPESFTSNAWRIDIRRTVTGHLHDIGPQFVSVFRCLQLLLKRMGSNFWNGEGHKYPQIVFDSVKDNPSYSKLLHTLEPADDQPWFLAWFAEYLHTIKGLPMYVEVLAKMVDFMCEELQHERFQEARPVVMRTAACLLSSVFRECDENSGPCAIGASSVLDIHVDVFIAVAFARPYNGFQWKNARKASRELITTILARDVQSLSDAIHQFFRRLAKGVSVPVPALPSIRKQLWKKSYETLQTGDSTGIAMMTSIIARSAHLDALNKRAFRPTFQKSGDMDDSDKAEVAFDDVNYSLSVIRDGFLDAMSKYANYNVSSVILDLLRREGLVKDVLALMLSPIEDYQVAAQTLLGQAFDVDVRLDCFRALILNLPNVALDGLLDFMGTFIQFASSAPEACSLSKSLVRCLTDIIEVLCSSLDGLLHNQVFLYPPIGRSPAAELPKLWSLMTKCIAVIFRRTPLWSTYFENDDMIVWMRDALIFGRDMLAQRRVIETAVVGESLQPPSRPSGMSRQLSNVGRKMVSDLQEVLPELARWLRLTDEELLHQSFALLQSLLECFRESGIRPLDVGIGKLNRHIDDARKKDPSRPQTRLDSTRLSKLEDSLSTFAEDDEIQIVSHASAPPQKSTEHISVSKFKAAPTQRSVSGNRKMAASLATSIPSRKPSTSGYFAGFHQTKSGSSTSVSSLGTSEPSKGIHVQQKRNSVGSKYEGTLSTAPTSDSSSSRESDSEGEEETEMGLASLGKFQTSPKIKKPTERRQVRMLDIPTSGKAPGMNRAKQRDDARRTALRLKPDISRLHRILLSWNYDHQGSEPPVSGNGPTLMRVPDQFHDHRQYLDVFEPLLVLECWSQIVRSKEDVHETYMCKIGSRQFTDDWLDLDVSISDVLKSDWFLTDTDIVLFRQIDGNKCLLGKTLNYKATPIGVQATIRCFLPGGSGDPGLQINSTWHLGKVFSLSTIHREYAALMALPYYDLYENILRPQLSSIAPVKPKYIQEAMASYKVNEPQAIAILNALRAEGFLLIQGPPGTGKTSTICGLVQAFISKRPRPATTVFAGRHSGQLNKEPPRKVLLCAPSNAAIDEVASRVRGIGNGTLVKVVRVGADKTINVSVKDISLDYLVNQKLTSHQASSNDSNNEIRAIRSEINSVKMLKQQTQEELSQTHNNTARTLLLEGEIKKLNLRRMTLTQQFDRLKDKQQSDSRTLDATRRKFRVDVLQEADIICSTLSGAGHEVMEQFEFEMVVIDEAAQAIELSSLIPLKYRCKSCIMVGDPQQLPPTVLSLEATKYQYHQSLFVRLQKRRPEAVHLLSIQYRMHPDISQLPSQLFYQGRLQDGPSMAVKTKQLWHAHTKFGTYRFFNISRGHEEQGGHQSLKNKAEAQVAAALYTRLRQEFASFNFDFKVGIVSMYKAQILELRRVFQDQFGRDILQKVDFNTVDGFQGQEKDVIILSCVRAGPGLQTVGFLKDTRRMNVALTRARCSLFILGNAPTLERSDENWKVIIANARSRLLLIDADTAYFTASKADLTHTPPRRPKSSKASSSVEQSMPALPVGLATPRELKASIGRQSPVQSDATTVMNSDLPKDVPDKTTRLKNITVDDSSTAESSSNVKARLLKRPKQVANIFIPKSNKRKPPEGDHQGPSSKRRL